LLGAVFLAEARRDVSKMDETELKAEARLLALEYMVTNMYVVLHRLFQSPPDAIVATHE
jgi:hypothetical protein